MLNENRKNELLKQFEYYYRKCKRTNVLMQGKDAVRATISDDESLCYLVGEEKIRDFGIDIEGYRITVENRSAFFPKNLRELKIKNGIDEIRAIFLEIELVTPPYFAIGRLRLFAEYIKKSPVEFRKDIVSSTLSNLYKKTSIASFCVEVYKKNKSIEPYFFDIIEAIEIYYLGRNKSAILTLIPVIEGVIRNLGNLVNVCIENEVSVKSFVKVLKKIQQNDIKQNIFKDYDWFPFQELHIGFFDKYHERIQLIGSIIYYLEESLYAHTFAYTKSSRLNRNGAVHAFISDFDNPTNFLRLITLINALAIANNIIIGGSGMHPSETKESIELEAHFVRCEQSAPEFLYTKV